VDSEQLSKLSLVELWRSLTPRAAKEIAVILIAVAGTGFSTGFAVGRLLVPPEHVAQRAQQRETAMGVSDGVNNTFMLQRTPSDPAQMKVFLGGLLMDRDRYAVSGRMLTFRADCIPAPGESVEVEY
jgi:hypothetical protein